MTAARPPDPTLSSIDRALDLLFQLHAAEGPQGVTAVARRAGLPKSSAHRLLRALSRRGLVEQDERGRYRPGFALVALGLGALERDPVVAVARPMLERTALDLGETVFLCGARSRQIVVLDKAEGTGFMRAAPQVGARVPVHSTAVGRLFFALDPDAVELPPEPFESFGPATPLTRNDLTARVIGVRARGLAENRGEWIAGMWVLAAPISVGGRLRAALAVAAPESRMLALGPALAGERLRAAAARVEARLTGEPDRDAPRSSERGETR